MEREQFDDTLEAVNYIVAHMATGEELEAFRAEVHPKLSEIARDSRHSKARSPVSNAASTTRPWNGSM